MSLRLTPDDLDRSLNAPPVHMQLADHIRQLIADLDLSPGDFVPSENEIRTATGVSRPTISKALVDLELEGLIVRRQGKRAMVAIPPSQRVINLSHGEEPGASFALQHGATDADYSQQVEITKEQATPQDAEYLQVRKGTPILRRRILQLLGTDGHREPIQIYRQAFRYSAVKGTSLAYQVQADGRVLAEMVAAGIRPTHFSQRIQPRMPNKAERELLDMKVHQPVYDIVERYVKADDPEIADLTGATFTPVLVSRVITPCSRAVLYIEGRLSLGPAAESSAG